MTTKSQARKLEPSFRKGDILLGRSSFCYNHPGNKSFRRLVFANAGRYNDTLTRTARVRLVLHLIASINESGNRFMKFHASIADWREVPVKVAREKVGHALRDALLQFEKGNKRPQESATTAPPPSPSHLRSSSRSEQCLVRPRSPSQQQKQSPPEIDRAQMQQHRPPRQPQEICAEHLLPSRERNDTSSDGPPSRVLQDTPLQPHDLPSLSSHGAGSCLPSSWIREHVRADSPSLLFNDALSPRQLNQPPARAFSQNNVEPADSASQGPGGKLHDLGIDSDDELLLPRSDNDEPLADDARSENRCKTRRQRNCAIDEALETLRQAIRLLEEKMAIDFPPSSNLVTDSDSRSEFEEEDDLDGVLDLLSSDEFPNECSSLGDLM